VRATGKFLCVTDCDTNYLCQTGMFLLHLSHQHSGQIHCANEPQFLQELLQFNIKQLKVKNNSMTVSIPLSK